MDMHDPDGKDLGVVASGKSDEAQEGQVLARGMDSSVNADLHSAAEHEKDGSYIDPKEEAKLLRTLDLHIAPVMTAIFLLAYLDRSNIGNAATSGLTTDANLTGTQLNTAVTLFYATYVALEIPATVLLKKFRPSIMIPALVTGWGLTTLFSGFVNSFASLVVTRLILGAFESGLFPCLTLYLSSFYKRPEQGVRVAYLFVASALSGAFGGLIAYGVLRMDGIGGRAGWQWLYIIEGLVTALFGISIHWLLPDSFETAYYLSARQKEVMQVRKIQASAYNGSEIFQWSEVGRALSDYKLYVNAVAQFGADVCSFGFSTFLPTVIKGFGYSTINTQLITVPIYIWAAAIYLFISYLSDRAQKRVAFLVPMSLFTIVGYAILVSSVATIGVRLFACFLCATGIYCIVGLNIVLLTNSQAPYYKRATAVGAQQAIGNCAGFVAGNIYLSADAPRYTLGATVSLVFVCLSAALYALQGVIFHNQNKHREALSSDERERWISEGRDGDAHPDFRVNW